MRKLLVLLLAAGLAGAGGRDSARAGLKPRPGFVTTSGTRFLDPTGKPLLLHGIAIANKSGDYTSGIEASDLAAIRSWGMNCIRLAIFWDAIEPEPGRIDQRYLDRVARIVAWARAERIYVLLDMHQDLYSAKFSDGAPAWATLDEGKPHVKGPVWSDSYYASPAVQTALDHFWANDSALQDHYARAWAAVAGRFKNEPAVLGYDLMNEPFPGSGAPLVIEACMQHLAAELAKRHPEAPTAEQLASMEMTPEGRRKVTAWLSDIELYRGMVDGAAPLMQEFERRSLMPLYDRLRRAIRAVDRDHILFLEPAMSANMGFRSAISPLLDERGLRDPLQAYAPHGYDIVVDTGAEDLNDHGRIELIFRRHGEWAREHAMPMLVGEWGAYHPAEKAVETARFTVRQFDRLGCGDTFWAYRRGFGRSPLLPALRRNNQPSERN